MHSYPDPGRYQLTEPAQPHPVQEPSIRVVRLANHTSSRSIVLAHKGDVREMDAKQTGKLRRVVLAHMIRVTGCRESIREPTLIRRRHHARTARAQDASQLREVTIDLVKMLDDFE